MIGAIQMEWIQCKNGIWTNFTEASVSVRLVLATAVNNDDNNNNDDDNNNNMNKLHVPQGWKKFRAKTLKIPLPLFICFVMLSSLSLKDHHVTSANMLLILSNLLRYI